MPENQFTSNGQEAFRGFEHLSANFIYCPNQFLDLCLPNSSRGTVRLVGHVLRRTLGWLDRQGQPIEQNIRVSFGELISQAGISRGAIAQAVEEAIEARYIARSEAGRPNSPGQAAKSARYILQWDERADCVRDLENFGGFHAGEGHRTPVPNAFFETVIPQESLAVIKVVGTVLRHTVGYQNQFGGRRTEAALSYDYLQRKAGIDHRPTLAAAIRTAIAKGYIECVEPGVFDPAAGRQSRPAKYAVKWLSTAKRPQHGSKTEPASSQRFKTRTGNGSLTAPDERFKNRTDRKTDKKDTLKTTDDQPVAAVDLESVQLLVEEGMDRPGAARLARMASPQAIQRQIEWLDSRNPSKNRLGMLRRAIEEDWSAPDQGLPQTIQPRAGLLRQAVEREREEAQVAQQQLQRLQRRQALLRDWRQLSDEQRRQCRQRAIDGAEDEFLSRKLQRCDLAEPPLEILQQMSELAQPASTSSS